MEFNVLRYNNSRDDWITTAPISNIYKLYHRVLILCLKNGHKHNDNIFEMNVSNIKEISDKYTLIEEPIRFIKSKLDIIMTISGEVLSKYFLGEFAESELIIPLYLLNEEAIQSYFKQYNGIGSLKEYLSIIFIDNYLNVTNVNETQRKNRILLINNIQEGKYWSFKYNCNQNITNKYINRSFRIRDIPNIKDNIVKDILKNINDKDFEKDNYLGYIYRKQEYVDAASSLKANGYRLYYITTNKLLEHISQEKFNEIIKIIIKSNYRMEFYYLILNMLVSKDYCHLIINNKYVLEQLHNGLLFGGIKSFIERYAPIFKYVLSYAWICLYLEESILKRKTVTSDRFVFDIDTATLLPYFPFNTYNPTTSPYLPLMVNKNIVNAQYNCLGVPQLFPIPTHYGVCNKIEFLKRQHIFMFGNENLDLFENINWNNIAISGSIMAACLPKFNPLTLSYTENNIINWKKFFDKYYTDADVDMMCLVDGIPFIDKVYHIIDTLSTNIKKNNINCKNDDITVNPIKTTHVFINYKYAVNNIVNDQISLNDIIKNPNNDIVKQILYNKYCLIKSNIKNKSLNQLHLVEYEPASIDKFNIIIYKPKNAQQEEIEYFKYNEALKYKISSPYLERNLEIFNVRFNDFFGVVSQFHLPIVRAYFTNNQVYCLPSCITACHTFMNIDYKYFAGTNDPIEIINKYRMRGFGTYLNDDEKVKLIDYSYKVNKWKEMYGLIKINFHTHLFGNFVNNKQIFTGFYTPYSETWKTIFDLAYPTKILKDVNIIDQYCINDIGYVVPFKDWLIDYAYNLL